MKASSTRTLRFTHVQLKNWRNFTRVDVGLERRVFLVGPNASGKSNLLDVFRFLHDIVAIGGGFQQAVLKRTGVKSIRCLAARRYPDIGVTVRIGTDEQPTLWQYEFRFTQDKQRRPQIKKERVVRDGTTILNRPDDDDRNDPARLGQTYLEQVQANKEFRDIAAFFAGVRYLHIVPQLVREPDRSVGKHNDPFGGDFLDLIATTMQRTQRARLRQIVSALNVAVPQLQDLELFRDERGTPHLRGKYEHWRPQGAWQTEDQFSDGTLRLLGLLWAVLGGSGPLLLEEPELSLHPEVVNFIPQMLARVQRKSRRQILLSTHSSDLLRDDGIGLDEVLLLTPSPEGTDVCPAGAFQEVRDLLRYGSSMAEAVIPRTRPTKAQQFTLFPD